MKLNQQNKFVRFILRAVDVCVGFAMPRPVRWKDEPFRKATGREWRLGWFFVAFFPIFSFLSEYSIVPPPTPVKAFRCSFGDKVPALW